MKFDFEKYKGQNVAMHCKTEREAINFCNYMHEHGKIWDNGRSYKEVTYYNNNKEETCYNFNSNLYCDIQFYKNAGYLILEWSDYMNKFTKSDLKNGDVLVRRNGVAEIAIPEVGVTITEKGYTVNCDLIKSDLTSTIHSCYDIVKVYRPKCSFQCTFNKSDFTCGELIFDRDAIEPVEVTLEEIAALKGVSVDRIRIKD